MAVMLNLTKLAGARNLAAPDQDIVIPVEVLVKMCRDQVFPRTLAIQVFDFEIRSRRDQENSDKAEMQELLVAYVDEFRDIYGTITQYLAAENEIVLNKAKENNCKVTLHEDGSIISLSPETRTIVDSFDRALKTVDTKAFVQEHGSDFFSMIVDKISPALASLHESLDKQIQADPYAGVVEISGMRSGHMLFPVGHEGFKALADRQSFWGADEVSLSAMVRAVRSNKVPLEIIGASAVFSENAARTECYHGVKHAHEMIKRAYTELFKEKYGTLENYRLYLTKILVNEAVIKGYKPAAIPGNTLIELDDGASAFEKEIDGSLSALPLDDFMKEDGDAFYKLALFDYPKAFREILNKIDAMPDRKASPPTPPAA